MKFPSHTRFLRAHRLLRPRVWRTLLWAATEPANDRVWEFILRRDTHQYLGPDAEPWFAPAAVDALAGEVGPGTRVLEWGAGASTVWFARRGCEVTSIETEPTWAARVRESAPGATIVLCRSESPEYLPDPAGNDLVVIDGIRRSDCARHLVDSGFHGLVVLDDAQWHLDAADLLAAQSVQSRHFPGVSSQLAPRLTSLYRL